MLDERDDANGYATSSSILMRKDFRNFKSWSLILNSGLVVSVVRMAAIDNSNHVRPLTEHVVGVLVYRSSVVAVTYCTDGSVLKVPK